MQEINYHETIAYYAGIEEGYNRAISQLNNNSQTLIDLCLAMSDNKVNKFSDRVYDWMLSVNQLPDPEWSVLRKWRNLTNDRSKLLLGIEYLLEGNENVKSPSGSSAN